MDQDFVESDLGIELQQKVFVGGIRNLLFEVAPGELSDRFHRLPQREQHEFRPAPAHPLQNEHASVALGFAGVQRYGGTLGAHTFQEKLQGKLDVVVFINAAYGYSVAGPIISIEHADGRLFSESVTRMEVYSNCDVREPVLYLNWTDLCKAINAVSSGREGVAWLFSFSLPEKYWNSKIKLVWGKNSEKAAKMEFDLFKLH